VAWAVSEPHNPGSLPSPAPLTVLQWWRACSQQSSLKLQGKPTPVAESVAHEPMAEGDQGTWAKARSAKLWRAAELCLALLVRVRSTSSRATSATSTPPTSLFTPLLLPASSPRGARSGVARTASPLQGVQPQTRAHAFVPARPAPNRPPLFGLSRLLALHTEAAFVLYNKNGHPPLAFGVAIKVLASTSPRPRLPKVLELLSATFCGMGDDSRSASSVSWKPSTSLESKTPCWSR
jgi:hypothetical protein